MKFKLRNIILFSVFSVALLSIVSCDHSNQSKITNPQSLKGNYLNLNDTAHYVGMNQCKLCHQKIYDSFIQTGMGKSFDYASKQKSSAKFDKHSVIYDKYLNFYYYPFWDGDSMKIMEFRLKGMPVRMNKNIRSGGDTIYKRIEKVDYIVGSGQHTNSHISSTNGYLCQLPMTYYTQKGQWDFPPGFENGFNTRFSRKIGLECISCHNSLPDFVEGSENKFVKLPEGITCERCHGPGGIHIQQRSTGVKIDTSKYIDYSIVNPGKLPIDLQFDVCQRCHLQGNSVLKDGKSFFDFKPGMKLSDYMITFLPRYKNADEEFIMASHADRLKQSKCFINSFKPENDVNSLRPYKNSLTCVTCHNPHVSVKTTGTEVYNNACKNCHGKMNQTLCAEKQELRDKSKDNCVICHMPKSGSIDIPHVTVHDHYIRKPIKKEKSKKQKEFIGLGAVNEKNPSVEIMAKAYIQQYDKFDNKPAYLDSAKKYLSDKTTNDVNQNFEILVHLYFIRHDFAKIIIYVNQVGKENLLNTILTKKSWDNANAWTLYRIGNAYSNTGKIQDAYEFYKKATDLAPYIAEFKNKLGASLLAQNKVQDAVVIFLALINENPEYVQALNNWGYANLLLGKSSEAETIYSRALKLDPDYEPLLMNVVGLSIYKKNYKKAKELLKQVLKKNPVNLQAKQVLEQLMRNK